MAAANRSVDDVQSIAVLGAGTMGHGIAQVAAMAGFHVVLRDIDAAAVDRGLARVKKNLDKGVSLGKVDAGVRDGALDRLRGTASMQEACAGADVVVEAVPEIVELKRELFGEAATLAGERAVLATNTSSLSIASIAEAVPSPERVVGMHFFNPVHIMKLVEVVHHEGTDDAVTALARALAERMGKTAITVRDTPGFASSRLGLVLGLEAIRMVEQGVASAADIDAAMKLGYGHPMGPLELTDLVGLDVRLAIADYLAGAIGPAFEAPELLREKVGAGKVGKKAGEGFYRWGEDGKKLG